MDGTLGKIILTSLGALLLAFISIAGYLSMMTITNASHVAELETHLTYTDHRVDALEADVRAGWRHSP